MSTLNYTVNNHLAEIGTSGKLEPELAESWEASPDAKEWTFKIRKGVEFHNGKTLDADDVVASVNHHRHEDSKSAAKALLKTMVDIKAQGKDTVEVTLERRQCRLPLHHQRLPRRHPAQQGRQNRPARRCRLRRLQHSGIRAGRTLPGQEAPQLLEIRARTFRRGGAPVNRRRFDPHQCPEDGRSRCDRPLRSQDRAAPRAHARHQGRRDDGHRALYDSDAYRHVALRQQPRPHGSEAGPGPGSLVEDGAARPRCGRQRPSHQPGQSVPCQRAPTTHVRSRQGEMARETGGP